MKKQRWRCTVPYRTGNNDQRSTIDDIVNDHIMTATTSAISSITNYYRMVNIYYADGSSIFHLHYRLRFHHSFGRTLILVTLLHYNGDYASGDDNKLDHDDTQTTTTGGNDDGNRKHFHGVEFQLEQMMALMRGVVCLTTINRVGVGCWLQVLVAVNGDDGGVGATAINRDVGLFVR